MWTRGGRYWRDLGSGGHLEKAALQRGMAGWYRAWIVANMTPQPGEKRMASISSEAMVNEM
jgi:hypothetical protein